MIKILQITIEEIYNSLKHGGASHDQQDHDPHKGSIGKYPLAKKEIVKAPENYGEDIIPKDIRDVAQNIMTDQSVKLEDFIYNAYEYTDPITGFNSRVSEVKLGSNGEFSVEGGLYDKNGDSVGMFDRKIFPDGKIEQKFFVLETSAGGNGFGKRFYQNQEETYTAAGFKEVVLHANSDVGGYAWARMGYDFQSEDSLSKYGDRLAQAYDFNWDTTLPFTPKHSWEIASCKDPDGRRPVGKSLMLLSDWMGVKKLDVNDEGYQIGQAYYNADSSKKSIVNNFNVKSTTEFIVKDGTDADLWGDIDSKIDEKWGNEVWAYIQNKYKITIDSKS